LPVAAGMDMRGCLISGKGRLCLSWSSERKGRKMNIEEVAKRTKVLCLFGKVLDGVSLLVLRMNRFITCLIVLISETKEGILTWDVRIPTARCLYELSTGNNQVAKDGLGWDWKRGTLWAATSSKKISSGWRPANVPPWNSRGWPEDAAEEEEQKEKDVQQADSLKDEDEEMEEDEDEGEDEEMEDVEDLPSSEDEESDDENTPRSVKPIEGAGGKWPIKAHHNERHFGWNYTLTGAAIREYFSRLSRCSVRRCLIDRSCLLFHGQARCSRASSFAVNVS
jgi:hypothetical protein